MMKSRCFLVTCEHGGNMVPEEYRHLFIKRDDLLNSHCGFDGGALEMSKALSSILDAPLVSTTVTRLLVDCNRSLHRRTLFSTITRRLDADEKENILQKYYHPYRQEAMETMRHLVSEHDRVTHISVHSFTPVLNGRVRKTDIGILYHPHRPGENMMGKNLQKELRKRTGLRVWRNYPFRGWPDGLVAAFRKIYDDERYAGIELELNRQLYTGNTYSWDLLAEQVAECIKTC